MVNWLLKFVDITDPPFSHKRGIFKREEKLLEKKFKELYLAGEIEFEAIDDYSYEWGMCDEDCTLREYLGLSEEEEDAWVSIGEDALFELLEKQRIK